MGTAVLAVNVRLRECRSWGGRLTTMHPGLVWAPAPSPDGRLFVGSPSGCLVGWLVGWLIRWSVGRAGTNRGGEVIDDGTREGNEARRMAGQDEADGGRLLGRIRPLGRLLGRLPGRLPGRPLARLLLPCFHCITISSLVDPRPCWVSESVSNTVC